MKLGSDALVVTIVLSTFPFWSISSQVYSPSVLNWVVSTPTVKIWQPAKVEGTKSAIGSSMVLIWMLSMCVPQELCAVINTQTKSLSFCITQDGIVKPVSSATTIPLELITCQVILSFAWGQFIALIPKVSICKGAQLAETKFTDSSAIGSGYTHIVVSLESIHPCCVWPISLTL